MIEWQRVGGRINGIEGGSFSPSPALGVFKKTEAGTPGIKK